MLRRFREIADFARPLKMLQHSVESDPDRDLPGSLSTHTLLTGSGCAVDHSRNRLGCCLCTQPTSVPAATSMLKLMENVQLNFRPERPAKSLGHCLRVG